MSLPPRPRIPWPASHELDAAPQLLVVALADAALLALERALDSAHPILAVARPADRPPPLLLSTERVATQVFEAIAELAAFLREYTDSALVDIEDFDQDTLDPF